MSDNLQNGSGTWMVQGTSPRQPSTRELIQQAIGHTERGLGMVLATREILDSAMKDSHKTVAVQELLNLVIKEMEEANGAEKCAYYRLHQGFSSAGTSVNMGCAPFTDTVS